MAGHSRPKGGVLSHAYVPRMTGGCGTMFPHRHCRAWPGNLWGAQQV